MQVRELSVVDLAAAINPQRHLDLTLSEVGRETLYTFYGHSKDGSKASISAPTRPTAPSG
jgi:hypothetical protein